MRTPTLALVELPWVRFDSSPGKATELECHATKTICFDPGCPSRPGLYEKLRLKASAAGRSKRLVYSIRLNLKLGSARAPPICAGCPWILTPTVLEALCYRLLMKLKLYLDDMSGILLDDLANMRQTIISAGLLPELYGRKRQPSKRLKSEIWICEMNMSKKFPSSIPTSWSS